MTIIYFPMDRFPEKLAGCTGFEWDEGNAEKSWERHGVLATECEQVFFQRPIRIAHGHQSFSGRGPVRGPRRRRLQTDGLFIVFTIRDTLIRVISARDMNRQERRSYENA